MTGNQVDKLVLFKNACLSGNLTLVEFIVNNCNITKDDVHDNNFTVLEHLAHDGFYDILVYLIERFSFTSSEINKGFVFGNACGKNAKIVEYCILKYGVSAFMDMLPGCFGTACEYGRMDVVLLLIEKFNITPEIVKHDNNYAFRCACENGHLYVAKFLYNKYNITKEDARMSSFINNDNNYALRGACIEGHLDVVVWLVCTFSFKAKDFTPMECFISKDNTEFRSVLELVASNGHLNVIKYMLNGFDFENITLLIIKSYALAKENGHTATADYLISLLKFDPSCL